MSKRSIGPGPGAYGLPPTMGYESHDVRKRRLPQYSISLRTKEIDKRVSPGPGAYQIEGMTRHGYNNAHKYTMGILTPETVEYKSPGPAAHEVHMKPHFKGVSAPAFSMVGKNKYQFKNESPGPNIYMFGMPTKPKVPSYTMGHVNIIEQKTRSPGPAAYGPVDLNNKLNRQPIYSMATRNRFEFKNCAPGSNRYNLAEHKPGRSGAAYTFGVKHNDYALPMVIECDNL